jgi:hypothetical protein
MADTDQEAQWRADFERAGQDAVRFELGRMIYSEPTRQFAFRWLREKEQANERLGAAAQWYTKWTFWAAIAAVIVGIIGVAVTYWSALPPK